MKITVTRKTLAKALAAALIAPLFSAIGAPALISSSNAAANLNSSSMQLTPISWNILGLDSNNVNVGPNRFPVGAKVCNKTPNPIAPTLAWNWGAGDAAALNILGPASYVDTITPSGCVFAFWTVEVTRASASYYKSRQFSISATLGTEVVSTDPDVALLVEKLVSQARNDVTALTMTGSLAANGNKATVTLSGKTSTAYDQLTIWPVMDLSIVRIRSISFTFSNDASTTTNLQTFTGENLSSPMGIFYADACQWDLLLNECKGSGKVGGTSTVTLELERVAPGNFSMNAVIYDLSGSSYHYNSDYGKDGVLSSSLAMGMSPINEAYDDEFFTDFNSTIASGNVAPNDTVVAGSQFGVVSTTTNGTLILNSDGTFSYDPNDTFTGIDSFTYKLCTTLPSTGCSQATVTIYVGVQAVNDQYSVAHQGTLANDVTGNDFFNPSGTYVWQATSSPASGTLNFQSTGEFTYVAPAGFAGSVSFNYKICKNSCAVGNDFSQATVTIIVGPKAVNDNYTAFSGLAIQKPLAINDITSATGNTYSVVSTTNANGSVTINPSTGILDYTSSPSFTGTASFTYKVCDSQNLCSTATVTIVVEKNQANNDSFSTDFNTNITSGNVATNDTVVGGSQFGVVSTTTNGALTLNSNGTFDYNPNDTFTGTDSFTYKLCATLSPDTGCSQATVTIYVGPKAIDDSYVTSSGALLQKPLATNDITSATGNTFSVVSTTNANGSVTINPSTGALDYISSPNFTGTASFTYKVCDAQNLCSTATVTIVVAPAPVLVVAPVINWNNPQSIQYPTPLTGTQLNAVAICKGRSVPGTYLYEPALGAVLPVGMHTLKVTWSPISSSDCTSLSTTVTINVTSPTSPVITWANPAPQVGPYQLNPNQLNAVCSVPGTLTYSPAAGTTLQPGSYVLSVTCIPNDKNYPPITAQVTFTVTPVISVPLQTISGVISTALSIPSPISNLNPTLVSLCSGISSAIIQSPSITYTPLSTFSGLSCINVQVTIAGVTQVIKVPILVNPVAPDATKQPVTFSQGLISWTASPNAVSYKVEIRGKTICSTTSLSCAAPQTVGPATPVLVTALGNDDTSTTVEARYLVRKVLAFTVYFDVAKFNLKSSQRNVLDDVIEIIKREGFTNVIVNGHTDSSPFDNQTLSSNRARTTLSYVLDRHPGLSASSKANADKVPAASNRTSEGKTKNRRAEGYVY